MPSCTERPYARGRRALILLLCLGCLAPRIALGRITPSSNALQYGVPAAWGTDLDEAIGRARGALRPILVFFSGADCPACDQLRRFTLGYDAIQPLIRNFERVEIDLSKRPELAMAFRVEQIPALYVIGPDGRIQGHLKGYVTAQALENYLKQMLAGGLSDRQIDRLVAALASGRATADQWRQALAAMEDGDLRTRLMDLCATLSPGDVRILVKQLADPQLAVRLGALDILEQVNDTIIGLDPWRDPASGMQPEVLGQWRRWSETRQDAPAELPVLTREKFERCLQDLIEDDPRRHRRALHQLVQGGERAARFMAEYFQTDPNLDPSALRRLKEVQYALAIPAVNGLDPQSTAHRIVWGNQDVQIRTIRQLADCGPGPSAILIDLLAHDDPLVRETAVEILFKVAGPLAVAPIRKLLAREKDPDICFTILKHLGGTQTPESQRILESYFTHANEDLVIAAIEGAAALSVGSLGSKMLPLLEDSRWRVRVAAIEAIKAKAGHESGFIDQLRGRKRVVPEKVAGALFQCLDDPDEFVRHTAAAAIGEMKLDGAEGPLKKAYVKHADMRGIAVSVLLALGETVPSAYIDDLFGPEPDDLLYVLDSLKEIKGASRELVHRAAASENPDIACSALRIVAGSEKRQAADHALLIAALQSGQAEKQLTVIQEFDLPSDDIKKMREALKEAPFPAKEESGRSATGVLLTAARLMDDSTATDLVRSNAVVLLCKFGYAGAFAQAGENWPALTASMRATVTEALPQFGREAVPLFKRALDDDNTDVWQAALNLMSESEGRSHFGGCIADYLSDPSGRLSLSMMWPQGLRSLCAEAPRTLEPFAVEVLAAPGAFAPDRVILALSVCAHTEVPRSIRPTVLALTRHDIPFIRRAAWLALLMQEAGALETHFDALQADPSKYVREIIPAFLYNSGYAKNEMTLYFSEEENFSGYYGLRLDLPKTAVENGAVENGQMDDTFDYEYGYDRKISQETIERLKSMMNVEPDALIRFHCMLSLLSYKVPLDLNGVADAARASGRPQRVADLLSDFFSAHSYELGSNFKVLLPLLQTADGNHAYLVESFLERWGGKAETVDKDPTSFVAAETGEAAGPLVAEFADSYTGIQEQSLTPREVLLFAASGCRRCYTLEKMMQLLKFQYPNLHLQRHDVLTRQGLELYEALSRKFMVESGSPATAPAVFMAGGYLIERDITFFSLAELVHLSGGDDAGNDSLLPSPEELSAAADAIRQRRDTISLFGTAAAGLLKGINPFALTACLLILYYLFIARRTGLSVLRYGALYTAGASTVTLAMWLLPQGDIRNGNLLHAISALVSGGMLLSIALIALRFFFRSFIRLRKKYRNMPLDGKTKKIPGRKHVVRVVLLWAVVMAVLDLLNMGDGTTVTLVYSIKNHIAPVSSFLMLIVYTLAFILPWAGICALFAQISGMSRIQSFFAGHPFLVHMALSGIGFWLGYRFFLSL